MLAHWDVQGLVWLQEVPALLKACQHLEMMLCQWSHECCALHSKHWQFYVSLVHCIFVLQVAF